MVIQDAQQVLAEGLALARQKQYQQAVVCFSQVLDVDQANAAAWYHRGHAYAALEQFAAARRDFKYAVRLDDKAPEPLFFLGILLTREGEFSKALWCFERAAALGHVGAAGQLNQLRQLRHQKKKTAPLGPLPPAPGEAMQTMAVDDPDDDLPEMTIAEPEVRAPRPLASGVQEVLRDFAQTHCGVPQQTEIELRRGLFGVGRKVATRRTRWYVEPLLGSADGESAEGGRLRFRKHPLQLDVRCAEAGFELYLWAERPTGGMLKHAEGEMMVVLERHITAGLPALLASLHQLITTGQLVAANGLLHYREQSI